MDIATPWVLLLLLLLPPLYLLARRLARPPALLMPSAAALLAAGSSTRVRLRNLPLLLRLLAITLLILALARPRLGTERIEDHSQGVAIEMAIDRSSTMTEEMEYKGRAAPRIDVAKELFLNFVMGSGGLPGRPRDLVGLITFAHYCDTVCPLTLGHDVLPEFLNTVQPPRTREEDGTAIGDAVALCAARLHTAEDEIKKRNDLLKKDFILKSKVIILLTDGQDNASRTTPAQAVDLCRKWGIKIYAIGIGDRGGRQNFIDTPLGRMPVPTMRQGVDEQYLRFLSDNTGGKYFLAESDESLKSIYAEIDRLEKVEIESARFVDYAEKFMPLAQLALALLILEAMLRATWLRANP